MDETEATLSAFRGHWRFPPGCVYLNHGSFGPPPRLVREARQRWQDRLDDQPMAFFNREFEPAWFAARERLAEFVGASPERIVFVDNATEGMNIVADSFPLEPGDEVLLTDHEYGAVLKIWDRACHRAGAVRATVGLTPPLDEPERIAADIAAALNPRTKLLVVSEITSPTAAVLPIAALRRITRERGIALCVDGPHAVAQLPQRLDELAADFYTASCHKWLCGPLGSGFVYADPHWHNAVRPPRLCWGRLKPAEPRTWDDEFLWTGTRSPAAYLATTAAIDFLTDEVGLERFRAASVALARHAAEYLSSRLADVGPLSQPLFALPPRIAMAHLPLPPGDARGLQTALWQRHGIEVPIVPFAGGRYVRVSCHLYNTPDDIARLATALVEELAAE